MFGQWQDCGSFRGGAMGQLTTHVLDTAQGKPAASIGVTVYRVDGERRRIAAATTNVDGRWVVNPGAHAKSSNSQLGGGTRSG